MGRAFETEFAVDTVIVGWKETFGVLLGVGQ